jgi:hypothetical protein
MILLMTMKQRSARIIRYELNLGRCFGRNQQYVFPKAAQTVASINLNHLKRMPVEV